MLTHEFIKNFESFGGLDLRSSELVRGKEFSTSMKNCMFRQTGALNKRPGYTNKAITSAGYGTTVFNNVNTTTGSVTEEVLSISDKLYKLTTATLTITGASADSRYSIYADGTDIQFYLYEADIEVLNINLGTGREDVPYTITNLVSAINAYGSGFSATGSSSVPAAFLEVVYKATLGVAPTSIAYNAWTEVTTPANFVNPVTPAQTAPFYTFYAARTGTDFENASFAQINDVLYINTGHDIMMKYDGTRLYRAGMPPGITVSAAGSGAGTLAAGTYWYKITYEYTDAKGNYVEGAASSPYSITTGAPQSINVTYRNLRHTFTAPPSDAEDYKGFDTDSSALKINIWRSATEFGTYSLVTTATNDPANDTDVYNDDIAAASLGADFVEPLKTPELPPICRYADVWRGMLILAGDPLAVNTVAYADIQGGNEIFPSENEFDVDTKITGLRSLDNVLCVFRDKSVDGVTGDLALDSFQVDHISRDGIGCVSHHSIQEVNGALFFLSHRGVYAISREIGVQFVSEPISPIFQQGNPYSFKRAVAVNWNTNFLYMIFLPVEPVNASYSDDLENGIYCFDYLRNAWLHWDNFNFMGGTAQKADGTLYIAQRTDTKLTLSVIKNALNTYDFSDHETVISFEYYTHWETLGEPSLYKKFLRVKLHSYDVSINDFESDAFEVNLITQNDYVNANLTDFTLDFAGGAGWGLDAWDQFGWGEGRLSQQKSKIASKKAKSIRCGFLNENINENVLISGWELEAALTYAPAAIKH